LSTNSRIRLRARQTCHGPKGADADLGLSVAHNFEEALTKMQAWKRNAVIALISLLALAGVTRAQQQTHERSTFYLQCRFQGSDKDKTERIEDVSFVVTYSEGDPTSEIFQFLECNISCSLRVIPLVTNAPAFANFFEERTLGDWQDQVSIGLDRITGWMVIWFRWKMNTDSRWSAETRRYTCERLEHAKIPIAGE
jgi:hypothetical protein